MNLILIEPFELEGDVATFGGARARHVRDVLRAEPSRVLRVGMVDGALGEGVLLHGDGDRVRIRCHFSIEPPPVPPVDLVLALPRPRVLRRVMEEAAALGVGRICLTNAWRVEKGFFRARVVREAAWRPWLLEGLAMCRDTRVPAVSLHRFLRRLVEDELDALFPEGARLVFHPKASSRPEDVLEGREWRRLSACASSRDSEEPEARKAEAESLRHNAVGPPSYAPTVPGGASLQGTDRACLAIGPEGGWIEREVDLFVRHGFTPVTLGPRILRSDTAVAASLARANACLLHRLPVEHLAAAGDSVRSRGFDDA